MAKRLPLPKNLCCPNPYDKVYIACICQRQFVLYLNDIFLYSFMEFFAVDFLLDDDLDVWVLEVNYNP